MANTKVSALTELTTVPDDNDMLYIVDISDTTMAASGTSKKNKAKYYLRTNGTANTLGENIAANGYNFTGAGTVGATRIGVGTSSPSYPFHISAASGSQMFINASSGQYTQMTLGNAGVGKLDIGWDNTAGHGYIYSDSALIILDGGRVRFGDEVGEAWTAVNFNTGWVDYGGGYDEVKYKKVGDLIFLRGLCKRTSGSSTLVTTLPVGYRPTTPQIFAIASNSAYGQVDIYGNGEVHASIASHSVWVSLAGLVFSTV